MSSLLPDTLNPATLLCKRFRPDQIPDLTGRVALVTGGSAGIGFHNVAALAQHNAKVHFVSANPEHGKSAVQDLNKALQESGAKGSIHYHQLDMHELKRVDSWAKQFVEQENRLDILIANAGIGQAPFGMTSDGLERHFEVNNLAHYVIVLRLLPLMQKTAAKAPPASVRIVMQSSEMHRFAPTGTTFACKEEVCKDEDGTQLYGRTKLGLIVFAQELARRKLTDATQPILAISVHPGAVDTDLQKAWGQSYGVLGVAIDKVTRLAGKSAEEGAEASLWAAVSTDINQTNWKEYQGKYYSEPYGKSDTESNAAKDEAIRNNFWRLCSDLTQEILGERIE
ncbi:NAD(P)-binding protein [Dichomitus squalens LYAD-421 SS1]|uniref:NAD(P)-binding protein n=1 Tax=Dichomitus squalens (strain LYAD-421) TaxID=732165 RepID=UPI000441480C|nr:NAD(P)-binding protein [Dichomitus squalens LYAD-421 SS1]EJF63036.1 NAD(P)-binding protein [Dichomitus squalens LYAD-421 SS1]